MKKQILVLAMVAFGTTMTVSAQPYAIQGSAPRGINCTDGPLNPIPGKEYTYQAASSQTGSEFTFWATKDFNFISTTGTTTTTNIDKKLNSPTTTPTGTDLLATSANYANKTTTDNVKITWSDAILSGTTTAAPTFIATLVNGTCADNFKAWAIIPIKAFTVDIRNIDNSKPTEASLPYETKDDQCFDAVKGAKWVTDKIEYDFGKQILYFEVIAANFTSSWTPTFQISGLGNGQTATLEWDVVNTFATATAPVAIINGTPLKTAAVNTQATSTTGGVSIYVRVTITNNTYEGTALTPITLTVDGQNSVGDWDIQNNTLTDPGPLCVATTGADQMDAATQDLLPRPAVTPVAPTPFANGNQTN